MTAKTKTKLTRSYGTTQRLERRIKKIYRALYGTETHRNSELHRKLLDEGLKVVEKRIARQDSRTSAFGSC